MSDKPSDVFTPASTEAQAAEAAAQAAALAAAEAAQAPPAAPVVPTIASEFVGEGKKYSSVEVALGAIPHAQEHIGNLEAENARLRAAVDSSTKLDDALSRIEASEVPTAIPAAPENSQAQMREEARNVYNEISVEQAKAQNVELANTAVFELYGEKASEMTIAAAAAMGVSVDFLKATAEKSPVAFMTLVKDNSGQSGALPTSNTSTINSEAFSQGRPNDRPSANVKGSGKTSDLVAGWRAAGQIAAEK